MAPPQPLPRPFASALIIQNERVALKLTGCFSNLCCISKNLALILRVVDELLVEGKRLLVLEALTAHGALNRGVRHLHTDVRHGAVPRLRIRVHVVKAAHDFDLGKLIWSTLTDDPVSSLRRHEGERCVCS